MTIVNNFSHPVILADKRDPNVSWLNHRARKSAGGVDLAYPFRTPIFAMADGIGGYTEGKGTGGNIYTLICAEGSIELMHLDAVFRIGFVKVGDLIGYSGRSGPTGRYHYAPHLHVHINVKGVRRNLWDFMGPVIIWAATAAPTVLTIPEREVLDLMAEPIYAKGDVEDAVYAVYTNVDGNTVSGDVYAARRHVEAGELEVVKAIGYPHPKQTNGLVTINQTIFDNIPKVAGSR